MVSLRNYQEDRKKSNCRIKELWIDFSLFMIVLQLKFDELITVFYGWEARCRVYDDLLSVAIRRTELKKADTWMRAFQLGVWFQKDNWRNDENYKFSNRSWTEIRAARVFWLNQFWMSLSNHKLAPITKI